MPLIIVRIILLNYKQIKHRSEDMSDPEVPRGDITYWRAFCPSLKSTVSDVMVSKFEYQNHIAQQLLLIWAAGLPGHLSTGRVAVNEALAFASRCMIIALFLRRCVCDAASDSLLLTNVDGLV